MQWEERELFNKLDLFGMELAWIHWVKWLPFVVWYFCDARQRNSVFYLRICLSVINFLLPWNHPTVSCTHLWWSANIIDTFFQFANPMFRHHWFWVFFVSVMSQCPIPMTAQCLHLLLFWCNWPHVHIRWDSAFIVSCKIWLKSNWINIIIF